MSTTRNQANHCIKTEKRDAHNHSLLNQNLQFIIVFQSNMLSLASSFCSLGVGLGVLPPPPRKSPGPLPIVTPLPFPIPFFIAPALTLTVDAEARFP